MKIDGRRIFLLDGVGAVLSVFLLGIVLPAMQPWLGVPHRMLYGLALLPVVYALYSFGCYVFADHRNPRWLMGIVVANTAYCVLTMSLLVVHAADLTLPGAVYFACDAVVILGVVALEWSVLGRVRAAAEADRASGLDV